MAEENVSGPESKHIAVKYFAVRNDVKEKRIAVERVATKDNAADLMTKPLGRVKFEEFRSMMGVVPLDSEGYSMDSEPV